MIAGAALALARSSLHRVQHNTAAVSPPVLSPCGVPPRFIILALCFDSQRFSVTHQSTSLHFYTDSVTESRPDHKRVLFSGKSFFCRLTLSLSSPTGPTGPQGVLTAHPCGPSPSSFSWLLQCGPPQRPRLPSLQRTQAHHRHCRRLLICPAHRQHVHCGRCPIL